MRTSDPGSMARVILSRALAERFTAGETEIEVAGTDVRAVIRALDARFPGLGACLTDDMAVAIDCEIFQDPLLEAVGPESEVCFLPPIRGGGPTWANDDVAPLACVDHF